MKRAIVLGGGGPACGLQIGAMRALAEHGIEFDVWCLSCIGAWVGIAYHQFEGSPQERVKKTYGFFRKVFVDDDEHAGFPTNRVFAPDMRGNAMDMLEFMTNLNTYKNLFLPRAMMGAWRDVMGFATDRSRWTEGDANMLMLRIMSAHPVARLMISAIYRTQSHGLARMHYPDSKFMKEIRFDRLREPDRPVIYHNAHNLTKGRLEHFSNRSKLYPEITVDTLCACSALPMVLKTVSMNGDDYCEGAMDRPLDFDCLAHHPEIEEVWSIPILDASQVQKPKDLAGAMGNLPMMPAAAHGKSLAEAFQRDNPNVKFVEIEPSSSINYDWSVSNLENSCQAGYSAAQMAITRYLAGRSTKPYPNRPQEPPRPPTRPEPTPPPTSTPTPPTSTPW